ncbi:helix-turn-helix domain-containing protein [Paraburkholderia sp. RL17-337-BIB-A]|uniref:helix-turn-helix domain-containing protein n=1 Tax=Paraburkholderia sp. RL17-337-BIB-A TaxID=3031636 RepID=UPI0038B92228
MDKDEMLTVEEAAKILFVSRTHVRKLLERGDLTAIQQAPESTVQLLRAAVLQYKNEMRARQKAGIQAMMDASERLGLYDQELEGLPNPRKD